MIVVVGEGAEDGKAPRAHHINRAQGRAVKEGAIAARTLLQASGEWPSNIELIAKEDFGEIEQAVAIAKTLRDNPHVLGVIGHASSGTTRAALPFYSAAGIPVIMPIATSPDVMFPPNNITGESLPYSNCLRLPPPDVPFQAAAVALTAIKILQAKRIITLKDTTGDAEEYSRALEARIRGLLDPVTHAGVSLESDMTTTIKAVAAYQPDLIIFCGYGTTAIPLLSLIAAEFGVEKAPAIILTDGSFSSDLATAGLNVYVTFPAPPPDSLRGAAPHKDAIKNAVMKFRGDGLWSYELFGFDATLLLVDAINACNSNNIPVSRDNVLSELRETGRPLRGAHRDYSFGPFGEVSDPHYYVYKCSGDFTTLNASLEREFTKEELGNVERAISQ